MLEGASLAPTVRSFIGLREGKPDVDASWEGSVGAPDGASLGAELLVGIREGMLEAVSVEEDRVGAPDGALLGSELVVGPRDGNTDGVAVAVAVADVGS
jgi:hypothetical protein